MNPGGIYPEVKLDEGVYRLTWSNCTLALGVRPEGDDVASIRVSGSACDDLWMLGAVFHRLAQWAEGGGGFIDEVLHDREDVVGSASTEAVRVRRAQDRGWLLTLTEAIGCDEVETEMRLKSMASGRLVEVTARGCPGPGTYQVMGDVLMQLRLDRLPAGTQIDEVSKQAVT